MPKNISSFHNLLNNKSLLPFELYHRKQRQAFFKRWLEVSLESKVNTTINFGRIRTVNCCKLLSLKLSKRVWSESKKKALQLAGISHDQSA